MSIIKEIAINEVVFTVYCNSDYDHTIERIYVPLKLRGQKRSKAALIELCTLMDQQKINLFATIMADDPVHDEYLRSIFKEAGFIPWHSGGEIYRNDVSRNFRLTDEP